MSHDIGKNTEYRLRQQAAVAQLGQLALAGTGLDNLLQAAVDATASGLEVEFTKVLELLPAGDSLLLRAGVGWQEGLVGEATVSAVTDSQAGYTLKTSEPVIVDDLPREERFSGPSLLVEHGVISGLSVIIIASGKTFGVLGAHTASHRVFDFDDANFLQSVANILGMAVERRDAVLGLVEAERKYRSLIENAGEGIFQTSPEGTFITANPALARMLDYSSVEELMAGVTDIGGQLYANPGERERFVTGLEASGRLEDFEVDIRRRDGSVFRASVNAAAVRDSDDRLLFIEGIFRDVTELKRSQQVLQKREESLAQAQRIARLGNWDWHISTNELTWSDEIYRIFGLEPHQFDANYEAFLGFIHPDDRQLVEASVNAALEKNQPYSIDHRIIRPDGSERIVHEQGEIECDGEGVAVRMVGTVQDVTERKRSEQAISLLQNITLAISAAEDLDSALAVTLEKVCEVTGWTMGEAWIPDKDGRRLVCSPAWYTASDSFDEYRKASRRFTFAPGEGIPGWVWKEKSPVWVGDIFSDDNFPRAAEARKAGISRGAGIAIPVLSHDDVIAVMDFFLFDQTTEEKKMTAMVELVSAVAAQLGAVIERKQAEDRVRDYNSLLDYIRSALMGFVSGEKEPSSVFARLLDGLLNLTGSEYGFIGEVFTDEDGKPFLRTHAITNIAWNDETSQLYEREAPHMEFRNLKSLFGAVMTSQSPVIANEPAADPRRGGLPEGHPPLNCFLGLPLFRREQMTGMVGIANRPDGYSEALVEYLEPFLITCANIIEAHRNDKLRQKAEADLLESFEVTKKTLAGVVGALAATVERRDPYTAGHQQRVARIAAALAEELSLPPELVEGISMAGILHDLGKISVPAEILTKPGAISEFEFSIIKTHPDVGFEILKEIDFPWPIARIVHEHHERLDGSGYPQGLSGEDICQEARILAVADTVEAMASHRPYRPSRGLEAAMEEISRNRGIIYDPDVVDACVSLCRDRGHILE